jgi:hypothetical protein
MPFGAPHANTTRRPKVLPVVPSSATATPVRLKWAAPTDFSAGRVEHVDDPDADISDYHRGQTAVAIQCATKSPISRPVKNPARTAVSLSV